MNGLYKYLTSGERREGSRSGQERNAPFSVAGLIGGLAAAAGLAGYKELIAADLANPVAEVATLLMFAAALLFALREKPQTSAAMVFLIPLIVWSYYLAEFSNSEAAAGTLPYTLVWLAGGMTWLAFFAPRRGIMFLFFLAGMATLAWHSHRAGNLPLWFSAGQTFVANPFLLFLLYTLVLVAGRRKDDLGKAALEEKKLQLERKLREQFEQFRHPVAHIGATLDPAGNILRLQVKRINLAFESLFRISRSETTGQELNRLFSHLFKTDAPWNDWLFLHPISNAEFFSPRHERWFNLHFIWFGNSDCICLFYDITAKEKTIRQLEDTKARYLTLLEAIPDIFFVIERDGTFQDVVFKEQEKFYPETAEIIGNTIYGVGFTEAMSEKLSECIGRAIDFDTLETVEYSLETGGMALLFEMRLARLNNRSVIAIARDITRRKRAEFELEIARAKAEEATALKSRFLANLSHDIRTPVSIITGLTKMIAEGKMPVKEREELVQQVQLQGNLLLQMIENTIQLSKIETNTLELRITRTSIHRLLRELYQHFYTLLPDNRELRLKLELWFGKGDPGFDTDSVLLREVLVRLLDNAVKFTREGQIRFGYEAVGRESILFYVEDTGPGIPESEQEKVFLRFYVLESDRKERKSGPGLGLPIASHFVTLLGGELRLDSAPGKGSRFWFRLPLKNPDGFLQVVQ